MLRLFGRVTYYSEVVPTHPFCGVHQGLFAGIASTGATVSAGLIIIVCPCGALPITLLNALLLVADDLRRPPPNRNNQISPGTAKEANWLPAPNDTIYLVIRLYRPKETPPSILPAGEVTWKPPAVVASRWCARNQFPAKQ